MSEETQCDTGKASWLQLSSNAKSSDDNVKLKIIMYYLFR